MHAVQQLYYFAVNGKNELCRQIRIATFPKVYINLYLKLKNVK